MDDHVRFQLTHQWERVAGGIDDSLVEIQRLIADRKCAVLRGGGEGDALRLHRHAPALPCLKCHVMATGEQGAPEPDHRECVAGVAEGAEQQAQPPRGGLREIVPETAWEGEMDRTDNWRTYPPAEMPLSGELGHEAQLLEAIVLVERDRGEAECADARVTIYG